MVYFDTFLPIKRMDGIIKHKERYGIRCWMYVYWEQAV